MMKPVFKKRTMVISGMAALAILLIGGIIFTVSANAVADARLLKRPALNGENAAFESDFKGDSSMPSALSAANHAGKGYVKAAETADLELYYGTSDYIEEGGVVNEGKKRYDIAVYDKRSGHLWNGIARDGDVDYSTLSESVTSAMQSLVTFTYVDLAKNNNTAISSNPMLLKGSITEQAVKDGIRLTYDISELSIKFSVDFRLSGDMLDVSIPQNEISEGIENYAKIEQSRKKVTSLINTLKKDADTITNSSFEGVSEERVNIVKLKLKLFQQSLISLSDEAQAGQSSDETMEDVSDTVQDVRRYLKEGKGYDAVLPEMDKAVNSLTSAFSGMSSQRPCGLVSLNVLPYFGAGNSSANGYAFYPDGCGAISYFNRYHSQNAGYFTGDVYANNVTDLSLYNGLKYSSTPSEGTDNTAITQQQTLTSVRMPVFGIQRDNSAFVSIIAQGDSDAAISYYPATQSIDMNYAYASFQMRSQTKNVTASQSIVSVIDTSLLKQPRLLRYVFLSGGSANYSGMAVQYRKFMEKYGLLKPSAYLKRDTMPLELEFFMGLRISRGVTSKEQTLTTCSDVQVILEKLRQSGIQNVNSSLRGWSATGYYNQYPDLSLSPAGGIGGASALKKLTGYAADNGDTVGLETQTVFGYKGDMPYRDVDAYTVKNYGAFPIEYYGNYIYSPVVSLNRMLSCLPKLKGYGAAAVTLFHEGQMVCRDYGTELPLTRAQSIEAYQAMGRSISQELGYVNYDTPNIYMANVADWMLYLPEQSSRFLYTDEDVPFYQMVVHGSVLYTGDAFNMMHDSTEQKLRYIEYGYVPFYVLTQREPNAVSDSSVDFLFSTSADSWLGQIESSYQEYAATVGTLWKQKIVSHERLNDDLACVTYDNGARIYINYSDSAQTFGSVTVGARSYKVVDKKS